MKKFIGFLCLMLSVILFGCTNDVNDVVDVVDKTANLSTEIYINNVKVGQRMMTRAINPKDEVGYSIPDDGKYLVFYYIRIDGNIPEEGGDYKSNEYFPRTASNKSLVSETNHGYVRADADWKSNSKFEKYIYDQSGAAVENVILMQPTVEELILADLGSGHDFSNILKHKDELHFIWYICKQQNKSDHTWHIDGVLTTKDRKHVSETDFGDEIEKQYPSDSFEETTDFEESGDVEVDIHQQEHKDWGEIKTSIHINDVTDVTVELPIESSYICEADDFAIRAFDYQAIVKVDDANVEWETVTVTVEHRDNKTVFNVSGITQELIDAHDGQITVEIHSYYKDLMDDELWNKLKNSIVLLSNGDLGVKGQIHSKDDGQDGKWKDL